MILSFGPLGWLRYPDPTAGGLAPALVYRFGLWLIWLAVMARLTATVRSPLKSAWLVLVFGAIVPIDVARDDFLEFGLVGLAVLAFADERWRRIELAALAVLAGLAASVKLNEGAEAFLLLLVVVAIAMRRRVAEAAAIYLASMAGFYFLATGPLSTLPAHLRNGWEVVSGYAYGAGGVFRVQARHGAAGRARALVRSGHRHGYAVPASLGGGPRCPPGGGFPGCGASGLLWDHPGRGGRRRPGALHAGRADEGDLALGALEQ